MSIFDSVMGAIPQPPEVNEGQHSNLVQTALEMFGSRAGLFSLVNDAQSQGLAQVVQSWVSTGANQPIAPHQLQGLLGEDRVNELARRVGVPPSVASVALSRILPALVDKLTPQGNLPQAA